MPPYTANTALQSPVVDSRGRNTDQGGSVYARVATFETDPANLDAMVERVRSEVESGTPPPGLEGAKMLMLVDRDSGRQMGITLFADEAALQRGSEALEEMSPGDTTRRAGVEVYEVAVSAL
jgi:hypothetical protein